MPTEQPPTLDPVAARRWAHRAPTAAPWLHEEVARRMAERLPFIRLSVQQWAHWEPAQGGEQGHALVAAHYPNARSIRVSGQAPSAPEAPEGIANRLRRALGRTREAPVVSAPPEGSVQLVWANMLAHQVADPQRLLADWHRALAVDGFVMFSCLGPDSLKELRGLYAARGWPPPAHEFTDMHDWGDQLVATGFAEPVMDMETLTLTFETPARLLTELRELGRNLHVHRFGALRTRAWRERLEAALEADLRSPAGTGPLPLTFELIYGHAIKPPPRHTMKAQTRISLDDLRATLRRRA